MLGFRGMGAITTYAWCYVLVVVLLAGYLLYVVFRPRGGDK